MPTTNRYPHIASPTQPLHHFAGLVVITICLLFAIIFTLIHPPVALAGCYCTDPTVCKCSQPPPGGATFPANINGVNVMCDSQLESQSVFAIAAPICGNSAEIIPYCVENVSDPSDLTCYGLEWITASGKANDTITQETGGKRVFVPGPIIFNGVNFGSGKHVLACNSIAFGCNRSDIQFKQPPIQTPTGCGADPTQRKPSTFQTPAFCAGGGGSGSENACELDPTGYSPADYIQGSNPEIYPVTWTRKKRAGEDNLYKNLPNGSTVTILSDFPGDPSAGDTSPGNHQRWIQSRIPYLKEIWTGLYNASNSVYRTMLPKRSGQKSFWSGSALDNDWPGETITPYTFTDVTAGAGSGKPGDQAKFYLKFLYTLNLATKDVIKSTNPYGVASGGTYQSPTSRALPTGAPATTNVPGDLGSAIAEAANQFNTPSCVLTAVARIEGSHLFNATSSELQAWLAPGGIDPHNCNPNPWGAAGPMQFTAGPWFNWPHTDGTRGYGSALTTIDPRYTEPGTPGYANVCNLRAALWGASKKLSTDSVNFPAGPLHDKTPWTEFQIREAARHYYGSCNNDSITQGSLGMSYCDFLAKQCGCVNGTCPLAVPGQ